jgi:hypothetical protein
MRGIQYAAASRFHRNCSGILDHPLARMMTALQGGQRRLRRAHLLLENTGGHAALCPPYGFTVIHSHSSAISPRLRASFALNIPPSHIRGRRECRAPDAPAAASAMAKSKKHPR